MSKKPALKGAVFTLAGGILWGFSGTCGQFLMQTKGLVSNWLVPVRLLSAGSLLLLLCFFKLCFFESGFLKAGNKIFAVWKEDGKGILAFGIFGMSMCQYTYFTAISASNAGTATVLQYLGPVLILVYLSLRNKTLPRPGELLAIALAVLGTYLLATHGKSGSMALSGKALFWGLLSAVALAVYTVQPGRLLEKYGSPLVAAWGMLIGGIMLCVLFRPWSIPVVLDGQVVTGLVAIVVFGTVMAFSLYMEGVRCVGPKKGSLYASVEPVSATVFSVVWMGAVFEKMDLIGFACILSTIFLLAMDKQGE